MVDKRRHTDSSRQARGARDGAQQARRVGPEDFEAFTTRDELRQPRGAQRDSRTPSDARSSSEVMSETRGEQRQRSSVRQGARSRAAAAEPKRPPIALIVAAVVALAVLLFAGHLCSQAAPVTVNLNGANYTLRGDKDMQVAIKESGFPVNPGDFISLKGNIIERGAGYPFNAVVNGNETADPHYRLHEGDKITLTDGKDRVEEYNAEESSVPYGMRITSFGAFHTFEAGADGVKETRTGRTSGEVVEKQTVDPTDAHENRADPNVGDEKVIALTFDDGPSEDYTREILQILEKNNAKATFFCRGENVTDEGAKIVREASDKGHQICSHGYGAAAASGGDMAMLSAEEQRGEVTSSYAALAAALGYEPSHKVRLGSGDMSDWVALNVFDLIDAEIGWTIDTGDWVYMTEDDIYDVLMSVKPGSIVRMHDGGGYQDTTVAALKRALPELAKQGYKFITIDEMLEYT